MCCVCGFGFGFGLMVRWVVLGYVGVTMYGTVLVLSVVAGARG